MSSERNSSQTSEFGTPLIQHTKKIVGLPLHWHKENGGRELWTCDVGFPMRHTINNNGIGSCVDWKSALSFTSDFPRGDSGESVCLCLRSLGEDLRVYFMYMYYTVCIMCIIPKLDWQCNVWLRGCPVSGNVPKLSKYQSLNRFTDSSARLIILYHCSISVKMNKNFIMDHCVGKMLISD